MGEQEAQHQERFTVVFPPEPTPGCLAVAVPESRLGELQRLEQERARRVWRVRGVVSDHVPLIGSIQDVLLGRPEHNFFLNANPLSIYLHHGANNACYYDFVGDATASLRYVEVRVETELPSNAFLYARQPLTSWRTRRVDPQAFTPVTISPSASNLASSCRAAVVSSALPSPPMRLEGVL